MMTGEKNSILKLGNEMTEHMDYESKVFCCIILESFTFKMKRRYFVKCGKYV